jgi:hypothetical protein
VFFQVDENCDLTAFAIGKELDSDHGIIVLHRWVGVPRRFAINGASSLCRWSCIKDVTVHLKVVIKRMP